MPKQFYFLPQISYNALVLPYTTGLTASKCDGFGNIVILMWCPSGNYWSLVTPKWYFTSPILPHDSSISLLYLF